MSITTSFLLLEIRVFFMHIEKSKVQKKLIESPNELGVPTKNNNIHAKKSGGDWEGCKKLLAKQNEEIFQMEMYNGYITILWSVSVKIQVWFNQSKSMMSKDVQVLTYSLCMSTEFPKKCQVPIWQQNIYQVFLDNLK